ncbi:MAG TPA: PIN domain nuclease [Thermoleophilaceae bacterium]|nr:PIN domain nuclease [Thermoleophilaceae bacterium]
MADTSAWVEFLRGTGSDTHVRLRGLLEHDELATTDVVLMEVLAGARDDTHRDRLRGLLARCEFLPTDGPRDYEDAAELYHACRRAGDTVRSLTDCLIASVAIRARLALLHADRDLHVIARHAPLQIA